MEENAIYAASSKLSCSKGVLFLRKVDGEFGFYEKGDKNKVRKYLGEIENGLPNGQGTLTSPDGTKYKGGFKDGEKHGQGTIKFIDGRKYVGEWKNGKYNGRGTFTWKNGDTFEGELNISKNDYSYDIKNAKLYNLHNATTCVSSWHLSQRSALQHQACRDRPYLFA